MPRRHAANNRKAELPSECRQTRACLLAFHDGQLGGPERQSIQRHLAACSDCRLEWEWHRRAEHSLSTARYAAPDPGDLRAAFYARLAATEKPMRPGLMAMLRRTAMPGAIALTALTVALIAELRPPHDASARATRQNSAALVSEPRAPMAGIVAHAVPDNMPFANAYRQSAPRRRDPLRMAWNGHNLPAPFSRSGIATAQRLQFRHTEKKSMQLALNTANVHLAGREANRGRTGSGDSIEQRQRANRLLTMTGQTFMPRERVAMADAGLGRPERFPQVAGSRITSADVSAASTRAGLVNVNEEVSIHFVNDKNEEVSGADVTQTQGPAGQTVIHVEADADTPEEGVPAP